MQSPTDIAGGSRIPKSQHGQRMTFHLSVLTFLYADPHYVPHRLHMPLHDPVISCKSRGSYGAHVLDHLAADGAGFAGGQVAVVAVLQVDADLPWCSFSSYFLPGSGLDGSGKLRTGAGASSPTKR